MSTYARTQHRRLDRAYADAEARDGGDLEEREIARPRRWRQDGTVSGGRRDGPRVLLMTLSERTSGKGTRYFSGWLGKARLVGFLSDETDKEGRPLWNIYASEPAPKGERS